MSIQTDGSISPGNSSGETKSCMRKGVQRLNPELANPARFKGLKDHVGWEHCSPRWEHLQEGSQRFGGMSCLGKVPLSVDHGSCPNGNISWREVGDLVGQVALGMFLSPLTMAGERVCFHLRARIWSLVGAPWSREEAGRQAVRWILCQFRKISSSVCIQPFSV